MLGLRSMDLFVNSSFAGGASEAFPLAALLAGKRKSVAMVPSELVGGIEGGDGSGAGAGAGVGCGRVGGWMVWYGAPERMVREWVWVVQLSSLVGKDSRNKVDRSGDDDGGAENR